MPAMTANEAGQLLADLTVLFFVLGMLAVVAGLWLHSACGWMMDRLMQTGPFRRLLYRAWLKKHQARSARVPPRPMGGANSAPLRARGHSGKSSVLVLFILSAVLVGSLAACAAPPIHFSDDHAIWLDRVKKSGW
jgi:hypothetical protein